MTGHRHVHKVGISQIYLRNATCTLHYYRIVSCRETVESLTNGMSQFLAPFLAEIVVCRAVSDRLSVEHHLSGMLGVRL